MNSLIFHKGKFWFPIELTFIFLSGRSAGMCVPNINRHASNRRRVFLCQKSVIMYNTMLDNKSIYSVAYTHECSNPVKRVNISPRYLSVGPFIIIRLYFAKLVAVSKIKCMQMSVYVLSDGLWLSLYTILCLINKKRWYLKEATG